MRLLTIALTLIALITPASAAEAPYFRVLPLPRISAALVTVPTVPTSPSTDPALPPGMSNSDPSTALPPGMGGGETDPSLTTPHNGLLQIAALPGWSWDVLWNGMPANLAQVQVYPGGGNTVFELTVRVGNGGCALATMGVVASTGQVSFSTFRDDSHGACLTPSTADWSTVTGQAFPSSVRVVKAGSLPTGNGWGSYTNTSASFALAH